MEKINIRKCEVCNEDIVWWCSSVGQHCSIDNYNKRRFCGRQCSAKVNPHHVSRQPLSKETKLKMSSSHKGEKSYLWKGGISLLNKRLRCGLDYRLWRESVFKRDNWTCQHCGKRGTRLESDHIKPFAYFPELRFNIDNGRTLCILCHKKTDSYAGRSTKNYK